jgi:cellulose synthase/poly-beta-1,6-N-acetylglucosamine synthase-like glycosyltransferase
MPDDLIRNMIELATAAAVLSVIGLAAFIVLGQSAIARWRIGLPLMLLGAGAASLAAANIFHHVGSSAAVFAQLMLGLLPLNFALRSMRWPARFFFSSSAIVAVTFAMVLVVVTFSGHVQPLGAALSVVLLALELGALGLSLVFAFEIADALGHVRTEPVARAPAESYTPRVCLQVPAYNEPPELLRQTLEALARLDYPNYIVQVIVNNTTDPALWMPVEEDCRRLGGRFRFIHLPKWPGFKAGALNEATRRLDGDVEIVGVVDADYVVQPDFLRQCVPHLADPNVAFVQTPQHYRDWDDSPYLRGLFYAYRYFFEVTMVARARVNAIIFGGTMGLIRVAALEQIAGWAEWCITEDAEASLRLLAKGWRGVYINRVFGEGLMPLDFDGLRRQRFRWAFGGVQILRGHIWMLLGLTRSRLTLAQRYHYLAGGLGWFADPLTVSLAFFLLFTSPFLALGHPLLLRQLIGVLIVLPAFLLVAGLVRLGWSMRAACRAPWRDVPAAAMVMLALSFTVARACLSALATRYGIFLRTPKVRAPSRLGRALLTTVPESVVATASALMALPVAAFGPPRVGPICAVLLAWQAVAWGSAPAASLLAQGITLTPSRATFKRSPQTTGTRPRTVSHRPRRLVVAVVVAIAIVLLTPAIVASPAVDSGIQQALAAVPTPLGAIPSPFASPSGRPSGPGSTPKTTPASRPSPSTSPSSSPSPTGHPTTAPTPTTSPTPSHPAPSPTPRPTTPPSPRA